jgi:hypothetical protein
MTATGVFRVCVMGALAACVAPVSAAAPVLRSADVRITVTSPTTCEVTMILAVDGALEIDHRLDAPAAAGGVELVDVRGAQRVGDLRTIGRTQSLVLRPGSPSYAFRYRARQPDERAYRCPLWLPAVSTDGQSREIRLQVDVPQGAFLGRSMPALSWTGTHGSTTIGNLPAFVRVSYGTDRAPDGWDVGQVMDAFAMAVFAGASVIWVWRKRR